MTPRGAHLGPAEPYSALRELAVLYLKLGTVAFGGPAAHIALMEEEVVRRRGWLSREQFLDLLGATNLIPGPNSTEMAIHIGYQRAGWRGLLVAGSCFILPAALIVTALAWAYVKFGHLRQTIGVLDGVKPVVIAVIAQALWRLGRAAVKTPLLAAVGTAGILAAAVGVHPLIVLFGGGAVVAMSKSGEARGLTASLGLSLAPATLAAAATPVGLLPLFLLFLKIGSILFGSGYVLLPFLHADLVTRNHWMTEGQLMDAVAVGQVTPGPLFTTATFIGYLLAGPKGAAVATVGIFLPAFVFVAISSPFIPRLRKSPVVGAFLDGLNVASMALLAAVSWQLAANAIRDLPSIMLAVLSALLLFVFEVNSTWLVLGGAVVGGVLAWLRHAV